MTQRVDAPEQAIDFNNEDSNNSANPTFDSVLSTRLSRRGLLRGGVGTVGSAMLGGFGVSACGGNGNGNGNGDSNGDPQVPKLLGFDAVPKSLADGVSVPAGYTASVLFALGDPMASGVAAYRNDGTDTDLDQRAGDHHDGMEWFGLGADGKRNDNATERGLLAMNHEATTNEKLSSYFLHADGGASSLPRAAGEVDKEIDVHGISVIEIAKSAGKWSYAPGSALNFRLTPLSPIEIAGPARGCAQLITKYSPEGSTTRGTLNNCGTGKTPWGTYLTAEENWFGYFTRSATDDAARGKDKSVTALNRYGRKQGAASRHGWETGGTDDKYQRWDISRTGSSEDGRDDYRNEMNGMGFIVEIDPYDKARTARKRTGLGRFGHESAAFGKVIAGQPVSVYMGDDSRGEYIYKFVSNALWSVADANAADRMAVGNKYLDDGKLYVARFNADGTGTWVELALGNSTIAGYASYRFADAADIAINTRLAADAVGATRMDRPEWSAVNPANGEVYFTLTNNKDRSVNPGSGQHALDAANPRAYTDMKGTSKQEGNPNGHLVRLKEGASVTGFAWDVYLFGAEAGADKTRINLSALTDDQDFSSPDGLAFSKATGICWIETDDNAYTDVSNCMLLAAVAGQVGDGGKKTLSYTKTDGSKLDIVTPVGKPATADTLKRFLVGPKGCEITGWAETPDGKTIFVNIQHPGEDTGAANLTDPAKYQSQWPSNVGYGAGKRPRSATIAITKNDGDRIGT
ncbi:PhoX family phosphatase [Verminephrobacter aporrectodeae subsp. tuberculatae]|uniref:PhoX family protein n=1 Tax=Verminephrobacter aporrectodeae TaxID=1110389 RepID=UPI0022379BC3|nr:PhoX family phosphatase [Verminephrobacter aporrectodeae]MCW5258518.1 PhoX family phosphatase [Verminephrobacter aporrectodeae subsp. tuberculatae]